jgi:hypothetical protein
VGCGVKLIYYMQKFIIGGDIRHRLAIMRKADIAFGIYNTVQRHASHLEQVDFLPIGSCHRMVGVRKPDKRDPFILPVLQKNRQ